MRYQSLFRKIEDYPIPGVIFEDVTTFWKDPDAFSYSIQELVERFKDCGVTKVVGLEARGFVIGAPLAFLLHAGFVPARKPNKLPAKTVAASYSLEYGQNIIEIHEDAISKGDKVLLCDDILATGGTLEAAETLISQLQAEVVGIALLSELTFLHGRDRLASQNIFSLYQVNQ